MSKLGDDGRDGALERAVELVELIYRAVDELHTLFPGRRFTPDGHMVGSVGEVWARSMYSLELLPNSSETHDARARDGRMVQIKATQGKGVRISSEPEHLLVLALNRNGASEIYNGPGGEPWRIAGPLQKNGQRALSLSTLRRLMQMVPAGARLPRSGR